MKKLLLLLIIPLQLFATKFYIAHTGADGNSGTLASPWLTLNKAWYGSGAEGSGVHAGDTIYVRGGTYLFTIDQKLWADNGNSGHYGTVGSTIKIWAYPGERPVFKRDTVTSNYGVNQADTPIGIFNTQYIHIRGIDFWNSQKSNTTRVIMGLSIVNCGHMIVENCRAYHCGQGFYYTYDLAFSSITYDCNHNEYINCDSFENIDPYSISPYNNADGFSTHTHEGDTTFFIGCRAWWNTDDGFDSYHNGGYNNSGKTGVCSYSWCWSFRNGYLSRTFNKPDNWTDYNGHGWKTGYDLTRYADSIKLIITNCIAVDNMTNGIAQNLGRFRIRVENCTFFRNGLYNMHLGESEGGIYYAHVVSNVICYPSSGTNLINKTSTVQTSTLKLKAATNRDTEANGTYTLSSADFRSIDTAGICGNRLSSADKYGTTLPSLSFLHLVQGSDMVDTGTNVGYGDDLGAFQYIAGTAIIPLPPKGQLVTYEITIIRVIKKILKR